MAKTKKVTNELMASRPRKRTGIGGGGGKRRINKKRGSSCNWG